MTRSDSQPSSDQAGALPLRALHAALCARDAVEALNRDTRDFLYTHGLRGDDLEAMVAAGPKRLLAYRTMVQSRLRRTIAAYIPRVAHLLGPKFDAEFLTYMDNEAPRTPYLRDVPAEFVAWAVPRWRADPQLEGFIPELARYELLHDDVANTPGGGEPETGTPLALDRPLRVDGSVRLEQFAYAVHTVAGTAIDQTPTLEARTTYLLIYRNRDNHRVRFIDLTDRAFSFVGHLLQGTPVQVALAEAARDVGVALDDNFLAAMVHLLTDLTERGVLLGAEAATA
ncbi:MAG: putative DNA-binding domain-containing protein [Nannocystaceae bacterium]